MLLLFVCGLRVLFDVCVFFVVAVFCFVDCSQSVYCLRFWGCLFGLCVLVCVLCVLLAVVVVVCLWFALLRVRCLC